MTIEERVSSLEGAYYQVDQRLTDLHGDMRGLREEVAGLRQEMVQANDTLRREMNQANGTLRQEMRQLRNHLYGGIIAIMVAVGASIVTNVFIG